MERRAELRSGPEIAQQHQHRRRSTHVQHGAAATRALRVGQLGQRVRQTAESALQLGEPRATARGRDHALGARQPARLEHDGQPFIHPRRHAAAADTGDERVHIFVREHPLEIARLFERTFHRNTNAAVVHPASPRWSARDVAELL